MKKDAEGRWKVEWVGWFVGGKLQVVARVVYMVGTGEVRLWYGFDTGNPYVSPEIGGGGAVAEGYFMWGEK